MEQKEPEKKMPSMHANAIRRSAKLAVLLGLDGSGYPGQSRVAGRGKNSNFESKQVVGFGVGLGRTSRST